MTEQEMHTALEKVKVAMRRAGVHEKLDNEITDLIETCMVDLSIAGVNGVNAIISDPMVRLAFITFCKMHDGEPDEFDRLKRTYDEIKAQMSMSSGYTDWGD